MDMPNGQEKWYRGHMVSLVDLKSSNILEKVKINDCMKLPMDYVA